MPRPRTDLKGRRVGRLEVMEDTGRKSKSGTRIWLCFCDCGRFHEVLQSNLVRELTRSCGCLQRDWWALSPEEKKAAMEVVWK